MRRRSSGGGLLLFLEQALENGFGFRHLLLHLQLAEDGMPADVKLVPLAFDVAQGRVVEFAQETQGGGAADEREDFVLAGRAGLNGGEDHFHLLDDDALDLEELTLLLRAEFFGAGDVDEMVKLLPALGVVFQLFDELVHLFGLHKRGWMSCLTGFAGEGLRDKKDDCATAQFARDEFQAGIMNVDLDERGVRSLRRTEGGQYLRGDVVHESDGKRLGQRGGENAAVAVDSETAAGQGNQRGGCPGK